jgi:hypothetical protein
MKSFYTKFFSIFVDHHSDGDTLDEVNQSVFETSGQPTHLRRGHPRRFQRFFRKLSSVWQTLVKGSRIPQMVKSFDYLHTLLRRFKTKEFKSVSQGLR